MSSIENSPFLAIVGHTNLYVDTSKERFRVGMPLNANIAADTLGAFAYGEKANHIALIHENLDGSIEKFTFAEIERQACKLAHYLTMIGIQRNEPVAIHTGQSPQTGIAHMAVYKIGAIAMTLSHLYRHSTIQHIVADSGARIIITHAEYWAQLRGMFDPKVTLRHRIVCGEAIGEEVNFEECIADQPDYFEPVSTATEDPALLLYTSGSTGMPKGMLHAHRIIHGYRPSINLIYNLEIDYPGAIFWSPSDWAWGGGLQDLMLPAWQHGQTVVSSQHRFQAEWAYEFMERHQVTHTFMTPTAIKRLAEFKYPRKRWNLALRVIAASGESLPADVMRWAKDDFGIVCNEFYGLSEFTDMVGCCEALYPTIPGSMGRAYPGRTVAIIDEKGQELPDGSLGEVASWIPHEPTLFLGFFGQPGVPENLRIGNWIRSGDLAVKDENGYFWYHGRNDDLIKSAGYRIGPNEIENTLMSHPDVAEAAVVGQPDEERGAIVLAYIRLMEGVEKSKATKLMLQQFVKENLALYKHPRKIEFVDSFPLTSTGKIRRNVLRERAAQLNERYSIETHTRDRIEDG